MSVVVPGVALLNGTSGIRRAVARDTGAADPDDWYPTEPAAAIRALLALEPFEGPIWEPACGEGHIARVFLAAGHPVIASDLRHRGYGTPGIDFLTVRRPAAATLVTNPPFGIATEFAAHALDLGVAKLALLLPLTFLEGGVKAGDRRRADLLERRGLARVHVSARRMTMKRGGVDGGNGGGGMRAFAWFVWLQGHVGPVALRRFDWARF